MNDSDTDYDLDDQQTHCKQPSRRERKVVQSAASRLSLTINRARKSLARTRSTNMFPKCWGGHFVFASPVSRSSRKSGSKHWNLPPWRVIPCVLPSPDTNKVPVTCFCCACTQNYLGRRTSSVNLLAQATLFPWLWKMPAWSPQKIMNFSHTLLQIA